MRLARRHGGKDQRVAVLVFDLSNCCLWNDLGFEKINLLNNRLGIRSFDEGRSCGVASKIGKIGRLEVEDLGGSKKLVAEPNAEHRRVIGVQRDREAFGDEARQGMRSKGG